jgi:hypothetical protein
MEVFVSSWHKLKYCNGRNQASAFANTHNQPLQLLYSYGVSKLPGVASIIQTK